MTKDRPHVATARMLLRIRALRWNYFRGDLFDEHGWNILLVLYIADANGRDTAETLAAQEASVPPPVGRRWITHLVQAGLVEHDEADDRIRLTDNSRTQMDDYLQEVQQMARLEEDAVTGVPS